MSVLRGWSNNTWHHQSISVENSVAFGCYRLSNIQLHHSKFQIIWCSRWQKRGSKQATATILNSVFLYIMRINVRVHILALSKGLLQIIYKPHNKHCRQNKWLASLLWKPTKSVKNIWTIFIFISISKKFKYIQIFLIQSCLFGRSSTEVHLIMPSLKLLAWTSLGWQ